MTWSTVRLKHYIHLNPTKRHISDLPDGTLVSFVPMEALGEYGGLDLSSRRPLEEVSSSYSYFANDDVLVAKITPCFENGKGALAKDLVSGVGFGTTELHVLRARLGLDPRFLFYVTISDRFRKVGAGSMYGAGGQKRISESFVEDFELAFPEESHQSTIASFLDRETAKIDTLIEKKEGLLELLEEKRTALITKAVTKGLDPDVRMKDSGVEWLGEIPEHWEVVRLNHVIRRMTNGYVGPTRGIMHEEGVPYIQGIHIGKRDIRFTPDGPYYVSEEWSQSHSKSILRLDDVLMVQSGQIGKIGLVTERHVGANCHALIITRTKREVLRGTFFSYAAMSDYFQTQLQLVKTGDMLPHLNVTRVKYLPVALPPVGEQEQVVGFLDGRTSSLDRQTALERKSISLLQEHRTALISAAVTGKIDVRDKVLA